MEIRNASEDLKALLGVSSQSPSPARPLWSESASERDALERDRATLSGVGTEVLLSAADDAVRVDKVEEVRVALAASTYKVPAAAVATRLVDAMLAVRSEK